MAGEVGWGVGCGIEARRASEGVCFLRLSEHTTSLARWAFMPISTQELFGYGVGRLSAIIYRGSNDLRRFDPYLLPTRLMHPTGRKSCWFLLALFVVAMAGSSAAAMDQVTLRRDGRTVVCRWPHRVEGPGRRVAVSCPRRRAVADAAHGTGQANIRRQAIPRLSAGANDQERSGRSAQGVYGLPDEALHDLYDTSRAYAQWCGALFERLYPAFRNAWTRQGFEMAEPEFPLVAVVFSDKASYVKYSKPELGDAADSIIGYYNMESNRMIMYDLAGVAVNRPGRSVGLSHINQFLASPNAPGAVSTIVHEATHQIAFNSGLHQRLSDCPKWFSEGIAMYCETPDLGRGKGWAGIGAVNRGAARSVSAISTAAAGQLAQDADQRR